MPLRRRSTGSSATSTPADRRASSSRSTRSTQRFSSGAASGCYVDIYELSPGARVARSLPVCWPCGVASTCARVRFARPVGSSACGTPVDAVTADGPTTAARAISLLGLRGASVAASVVAAARLARANLLRSSLAGLGALHALAAWSRARKRRVGRTTRPSRAPRGSRGALARRGDVTRRWRRGDGGECVHVRTVRGLSLISVGGT